MAAVLYRRQREILEFLKKYIKKHGSAPTLKEIADEFELSSLATVHAHLERLEEKGYIRREYHGQRSIVITDPREKVNVTDVVSVPLQGVIQGNHPIKEYKYPSESVAVMADMIGTRNRRNLYGLMVKGNTLAESLVQDGDCVILEPVKNPKNGDTVLVTEKDGKVAVRKYYRDDNNDFITLESPNPKLEPAYVESVDIKGKVVGVYRKYG